MAISQRAEGTWVSGSTTQNTQVAFPSGYTPIQGDVGIIVSTWKAFGTTATVDQGWTEIFDGTGGSTAAGNGTGSVRLYVAYKIFTASGTQTAPTISRSVAPAPSASVMVVFQKATTEAWDIDDLSAATEQAMGTTAMSHVCTTTQGITSGDWIFALTGVGDDSATFTRASTAISGGPTWSGNVVEYPSGHLTTADSNDLAADLIYRVASSTVATGQSITVTATLSAAERVGSVLFRIRAKAPTQTSVAEVSLASTGTPTEATNHYIGIRGRITGGIGATLRAAVYEGANNRSGDLETPVLTTSLADFALLIPDASAANITDYSNLGIRFWGYDAYAGAATVFEVDQVWLALPDGASAPTGTFASTAPVPTSAWTGQVANPVTGTFASTAPVASSAWTGAESIPGTFASTAPVPTSAWTGLVANPVSGTFASAVTGPSSAFTASESIPGSFASSVTGPSSAWTGAEAFAGTFASTAPSPTSAWTGAEAIPGTFASAAPTPSSDWTGNVISPVTGTFASTAPSPSSSFTGQHVLNVTGTFASDVTGPSSAWTGSESIPGTFASTAPTPVSSWTGAETLTGTFASTVAGPTSDWTGTASTPSAYHADTLSNGDLAGYWRLGEPSGTSAIDYSGNGNTGTYIDTPTLGTTGLISGDADTAVTFNGSSEWVDCGSAAGLDLTEGTVEAWFKTSGAGASFRGLVTKQFVYGLFLVDDVLGFYDWNASTFRTTSIDVGDGVRHHVVFTFDSGVSNGSKVYLDGSLVLTSTMTAGSQGDPVLIGANAGVQQFAGVIDEVAVYGNIKDSTWVSDRFGLGGGSVIAGSFASTAPTPSSSFAGTHVLTVTGTFASTAPTPSGSFTGLETLTGVLASTAPTPSSSWTGLESIPGSLASTAPTPSSAFTGTHVLTITGTLASTAPTPTSDWTGASSEEVTGTFASVAPSPFAFFEAPPYDWSLGIVTVSSIIGGITISEPALAGVTVDTVPGGSVTIDDEQGSIVLEPELAGVVS